MEGFPLKSAAHGRKKNKLWSLGQLAGVWPDCPGHAPENKASNVISLNFILFIIVSEMLSETHNRLESIIWSSPFGINSVKCFIIIVMINVKCVINVRLTRFFIGIDLFFSVVFHHFVSCCEQTAAGAFYLKPRVFSKQEMLVSVGFLFIVR